MSRALPVLLAESIEEMLEKAPQKSILSPAARDAIFLFGAILAVTCVFILALVVYRKDGRRWFRRRQHRHHRTHEWSTPAAEANSVSEAPSASTSGRSARRRRHRRSGDYPRNPTLAETRGLPPIRDDATPPAGI